MPFAQVCKRCHSQPTVGCRAVMAAEPEPAGSENCLCHLVVDENCEFCAPRQHESAASAREVSSVSCGRTTHDSSLSSLGFGRDTSNRENSFGSQREHHSLGAATTQLATTQVAGTSSSRPARFGMRSRLTILG